MDILLAIVGLTLILTGFKNTYADMGKRFYADMFGDGTSKGFIWWIGAIAIVGAIGNIQTLRSASNLFLVLIIASLLLSNQGFFARLQQAIASGPATAPTGASAPSLPWPFNGGSSADTSAAGGSATAPAAPTMTFKQSLQKPGGGGFWDWSGIPSPFGN